MGKGVHSEGRFSKRVNQLGSSLSTSLRGFWEMVNIFKRTASASLTDKLATVSFVIGGGGCVLSLVPPLCCIFVFWGGWLYFLPGIIALVTGLMCLNTSYVLHPPSGKRALVGIWAGFLMLVWAIFWVIVIGPKLVNR